MLDMTKQLYVEKFKDAKSSWNPSFVRARGDATALVVPRAFCVFKRTENGKVSSISVLSW